MKFLFDFFPILLFFVAYKIYGIYVATGVAIAATVLQISIVWLRHRKLEKTHLLTLAIISIFGGATLVFHDDAFIKWKPTVLNWLFAVGFLVSHFVGEKNFTERMIGHTVKLPAYVWKRLNLSWVAFFLITGIVNLYVMYVFDTDTWVNFKLFGLLGMTIVFIVLQAIYLARHVQPEEEDSKE